jgi:hypothetical protein
MMIWLLMLRRQFSARAVIGWSCSGMSVGQEPEQVADDGVNGGLAGVEQRGRCPGG